MQDPNFYGAQEHRRGYLPNLELGCRPVFLTIRLADALPRTVYDRWLRELERRPSEEAEMELRRRIDAYLDAGHGSCVLERSECAAIVADAMKHFDGERYDLHAWVVMPNHLHAGITPAPGELVKDIAKSWKSFTARQINKVLGRKGRLWQRYYHDRWARGERHFKVAVSYIHQNPVVAGLCERAEDWRWSSARERKTFAACKQPLW